MEPILLILTLATLGELIIETLKPGIAPLLTRLNLPADINPYLYLSLTLGLLLAFVYQADLLAAIGLSAGPTTAGIITTGLFLGRGSNFVSDVIQRVGG